MKLLKNAVESIQIGLEDYKNDDPKRILSAVRNISAGILLLFKEKLRQLSPSGSGEALVKSEIQPTLDSTGSMIFAGKGKKTANVYQIRERFQSMKITVDWKKFEKINVLRNNVEHYYTEEKHADIREIISKSFEIIDDFSRNHLNEEPLSLFGRETWRALLEIDGIYRREKAACIESLSLIDWNFQVLKDGYKEICCPQCQSDLITGEGKHFKYTPGKSLPLLCKQCDYEFDFEDVVEQCVHEALSGEAYIAASQGGEYPYDTCPECSLETHIYEEDCCVSCGYGNEEKLCAVCHTPLDLEEAYEGDICSYHRSIAEKDI